MLAVRQKLNRYWVFVAAIVAVFLAAYGLAEALHVPFLTDTLPLNNASLLTALLTVGLLTADILLPVPSSLVMVANGALFGFWAGGAVSLIGNIFGFLFAYWLGRRSSPLVQRFITPSEVDRGNRVLQKWGASALILTRTLPILAETTAIMAGVARLPFAKSLAAVIAGSLPISLLYAWAGAYAKGSNATAFIFLALILLSAIAWKVDKLMEIRKGSKKPLLG